VFLHPIKCVVPVSVNNLSGHSFFAMPSPQTARTALVLIDIQDGLTHPTHWGPSRSNPLFEANAKSILTTYRSLVSSTADSEGASPHKIIHVAHSSLLPDSPLSPSAPGFKFQDIVSPLPTELIITKNVNSGFIGTNLEEHLRKHFEGKPAILYLIGLTTDHCVSTTTRMAGNLMVCDGESGEKGEVVLVEDATAAWKKSEDGFDAELVHKVHVESLKEFATIEKTQEVVESWKGWLGEKL
jgi:nicotinamidase-related amidase